MSWTYGWQKSHSLKQICLSDDVAGLYVMASPCITIVEADGTLICMDRVVNKECNEWIDNAYVTEKLSYISPI